MLGWLRRNNVAGRTASELYGRVVAQARQPAFYGDGRVADTTEGRFELIVLHLFLVLERLRSEGEAGQALGQALVEAFVTDMDDGMRELGISDLGVPRRIKKAAAAVQERVEDYRAGLAAAGDDALGAALARHLGCSRSAAGGIAQYVRDATRHVAALASERVFAGEVTFPSPPGE
jgi:cytochrome b pre-mRNA-processing protein 3